MSQKSKAGKKRANKPAVPVAVELGRRVRVQWDRRDFAQAVQIARQYELKHPSPECRVLLAEACLRLAEERIASGDADAALALLNEATGTEIEKPELLESAVRLAVRLKKDDAVQQLLSRSPNPFLAMLAADEAVVHGTRIAISRDVDRDIETVRTALAKWDAGDDEAVRTALQSISRQSPLADWRLFLRGLMSRSAGSLDDARQSWERLDSRRIPCRLARSLLAVEDAGAATGEIAREVLEEAIGVEDIGAKLSKLHRAICESNAGVAAESAVSAMKQLKEIEPTLASQLARLLPDLLVAPMVRWLQSDREISVFDRALKVAVLPDDDPKAHRYRAWICEKAQLSTAIVGKHWKAYITALPKLKCFTKAESARAAAMIHLRLGQSWEADAEEANDSPMTRNPESAIKRFKKSALTHYQSAIAADPDFRTAYDALCQHYAVENMQAALFDLLKRVTARFPDHAEAIAVLGAHPMMDGDPLQAVELLERAYALKSLDSNIPIALESRRLTAVRMLTAQREQEAAIAMLSKAQSEHASDRPDDRIRASRAILDSVFGDSGAIDRYLAAAKADENGGLSDAFTLLLEAYLFEISAESVDRIGGIWRQLLQQKPNEVAGARMLQLVLPYAHPRATQRPWLKFVLSEVFEYVEQFKGCRSEAQWLREMIECLDRIESENELSDELAVRGYKDHPDDPFFQFREADKEISRGPLQCDRQRAKRLLDSARQTLEAQPNLNPSNRSLLDKIRENATFIDEVGSANLAGMPFNPFAILDEMAREHGLNPKVLIEKMMAGAGFDDDDDFE